ncbi:hypothetical protein [Nonomuraea antri]|nr:hypothetical protein [Nonomuraea antri]
MASAYVIKSPRINAEHVGGSGSHRVESDGLWLDGEDKRSCRADPAASS